MGESESFIAMEVMRRSCDTSYQIGEDKLLGLGLGVRWGEPLGIRIRELISCVLLFECGTQNRETSFLIPRWVQ